MQPCNSIKAMGAMGNQGGMPADLEHD